MGMTIEIDVLDHFDDEEFARHLRKNDWTCEKNGWLSKTDNKIKKDNMNFGVKVHYGLGLKDESLAKAIEDAFDKHGYFLIEKLRAL